MQHCLVYLRGISVDSRGKAQRAKHRDQSGTNRRRAHGDHPHCDAFSVKKAGDALYSVSDRVAEIQYFADAALALILFDYVFLDHERRGDHFLEIERSSARRIVLKHGKEDRIRDQSCLDSLREAAGLLSVGQRIERVGVDQHFAGLPESADNVLDAAQVHRGLAAYGTVHLRQNCSRNIVKVNASHIAGRRETAQVSDNAAAH